MRRRLDRSGPRPPRGSYARPKPYNTVLNDTCVHMCLLQFGRGWVGPVRGVRSTPRRIVRALGDTEHARITGENEKMK